MSRRLNGIGDENYRSHLSTSDINHVNGVGTQFPGTEEASSKVDTVSIVGRLMQIREYLKQASDLKKQLLQVSGGSGDNRQNYQQLTKINSLVGHLREQEEEYMSLLSQLLGGCYDDLRTDNDSVADTVSINLDAQSDANEMSQNTYSGCFKSPRLSSNEVTGYYAGILPGTSLRELMGGTAANINLLRKPLKPAAGPVHRTSTVQRPKTPVPGQLPQPEMAPRSVRGRRNSGQSSVADSDGRVVAAVNPTLRSLGDHAIASTTVSNGSNSTTDQNSELLELKRQHELLEKLLQQQRQLKDLKAKHEILERLTVGESNGVEQPVEEQGATGGAPSLDLASDNSIERTDDARDNQHDETSLQTELHSLLEEKAFLTELLKMRANVNSQGGSLRSNPASRSARAAAAAQMFRSNSEVAPDSNSNRYHQVVAATANGGVMMSQENLSPSGRVSSTTSKENNTHASVDLGSLASMMGGASQSFDMEVQKQLEEKRMLELRLRELQEKKAQMDQLVNHLQTLKDAGLMADVSRADLTNDTQMEIEDGRQGGTESADDPLSQNSEHSGARLLPSNASRSGGTQGNGYTEFSESETSSGEEDSEDEDNDQVMFSGDVGGTRPRTGRQVQESDHRTSSEMIADLMDSEEKMRQLRDAKNCTEILKGLVEDCSGQNTPNLRKLQEYQSRLGQLKNLVDMYEAAANNKRVFLQDVDLNDEWDVDNEELLGAVGGVPAAQSAASSVLRDTEQLKAKIQEIESLKQGIEQIQNVLSTVQQSAFQLSGMPSELPQVNSSSNVNDQGQTSSADGMNMSQLEELRQMLRAAGSNLTPEQFLMSDNDENEGATKPTANKAANNANLRHAGTSNEDELMTRRSENNQNATRHQRSDSGKKVSTESSVMVPPQREVEGSVDTPLGNMAQTGTIAAVPKVTGNRLKSNREMWLEMRQQKMQREEAKNRARGRFGDGQSEDSFVSDNLKTSLSTIATYGGSPIDMGQVAAAETRTMYPPHLLDSDEDTVSGVAEDKSQYPREYQQTMSALENNDANANRYECDSTTSNETYTLEDANEEYDADDVNRNIQKMKSGAVRVQLPPVAGPSAVKLMPDNRKTDNRVAASRASAKTKNSWNRSLSRQRKQENISTVPDIALNTSHSSNTTTSTVVGNNGDKTDLRQMYHQLKDQLNSTNEMVRNLQQSSASANANTNAALSQTAPPYQATALGDSPGWPQSPISRNNATMGLMNPMDEMMRNMDFLMRQQMMLQMSVMYSNMTSAWQQNMYRSAPNEAGGVPTQNAGPFGIAPVPGAHPAIGFNPHNLWWPNNAVAPVMPGFGDANTGLYPGGLSPFGQAPNPATFDEASIHSLSTTENNSHAHHFSTSQQQTSAPARGANTCSRGPDGNMSSRNVTAQSTETGHNSLSQSWPTQAHSAHNKSVRRSPEKQTASAKPEIPPLGLVSETASMASSSDVFAQTFPSTESSKRPANVQRASGKATSSNQYASLPNNKSAEIHHEQNTGTYRVVKSKTEKYNADQESLSLFDALRDNIYSELACVITENESRPHFLIELFRELKMLKTDYLRQRALMLLQDLVNRYITEDTLSCTDGESGMKQSSSMASGDQIWFTDLFSSNELPGRRVHSSAAETGGLRLGATVLGGRSSKYRTGEETPSDQSEQSAFSSQVQVTDSGVFTTEGDKFWSRNDLEFLESMRKQYRLQQKEKASREQSGSQLVGDQQRGNTVFGQHYDYEEFVEESATEDNENTSEQSTPTFARDPLGDTAIYLEAVSAANAAGATSTSASSHALTAGPSANAQNRTKFLNEIFSRTGGGCGGSESDSSFPDFLNNEKRSNSVDTKQLDAQIKTIMGEIIPQLKNRMDEVCSNAFLNVLRKQVLQLASVHYDGAEEFVRFFHQQLSTVLTEALSKFSDQTLRDCGEDLLVEISEVLFNELAFFRMMRSLDGGTGSLSVDDSMEQDTGTDAMDDGEDEDEEEDEELGDASEETRELDNGGSSTSVSADHFGREAEEMQNERDDLLAMSMPILPDNEAESGAEDETTSDSNPEPFELGPQFQNHNNSKFTDKRPVSIVAKENNVGNAAATTCQYNSYSRGVSAEDENAIPMLSLSETRALISYGSGEDDDEDEVVSQDEMLAAVEEQTAVTTSNQDIAHIRDASNAESKTSVAGANRHTAVSQNDMGMNLVNEIMDSISHNGDEMFEDNSPPLPERE